MSYHRHEWNRVCWRTTPLQDVAERIQNDVARCGSVHVYLHASTLSWSMEWSAEHACDHIGTFDKSCRVDVVISEIANAIHEEVS